MDENGGTWNNGIYEIYKGINWILEMEKVYIVHET